MYVLTDNNIYIGTDGNGRPTIVASKEKAMVFKSVPAADNFMGCLPTMMKKYKWEIHMCQNGCDINISDIRTFGNHSKTTLMEEEDFDICGFFTEVIEVMSQLERFVFNMTNKEEITDMKIMDVRHYIRDNNHKLSAIQMQRLGYYLQDLEKERYGYKSKRLIASMFTNNVSALKDKNNIAKINDILHSKYNPKVLDDSDIEYIINKKKDVAFIA